MFQKCLGYLMCLCLAAAVGVPVFGDGENDEATTGKETEMTFELKSPSFVHNQRMPKKHAYTGEGENLSPALEWTDPPEGTKSYALICNDPDAPAGTWTHWVLWNLPTDKRALPEGVPTYESLPDLGDAQHGNNDFSKLGYGGPMPPSGHGDHHYNFTLYALDTMLELEAGSDRGALLAAMEGHILGKAKLTGTYSR